MRCMTAYDQVWERMRNTDFVNKKVWENLIIYDN
jgi:hypothetical protein